MPIERTRTTQRRRSVVIFILILSPGEV